jgi:hypothetical protein
MSVGGKVTEVIDAGDRVWVDTKEREQSTQTCAIYVERTPLSLSISKGDSLWWQGGRAYWTAKDRAGKLIGKPDTVLKRIGYSGVSRPATAGDFSP